MPPTPVAAPWYGSMNDGMVVRLDFEDRRQAVADVDDAGVLARSLQHALAGRRQLLQVDPRALVAAVLGPHDREDAELGFGGLALQQRDDAIVFFLCDGHRRYRVRAAITKAIMRSAAPVTRKTLASVRSVPSA